VNAAGALRGAALGVLLAAVVAGTPAGDAPRLVLQEPKSGREVRVEPGAAALHLVLFATWCQACMDELERLAVLEERWKDRGYRLVLIAVSTRQSPERLVRLLEGGGVPGELLFDPAGQAQQALRAEELPLHVLLDASGGEVLRADRLGREIDEALERLLLGAGARP
jgi:hypothetical protein